MAAVKDSINLLPRSSDGKRFVLNRWIAAMIVFAVLWAAAFGMTARQRTAMLRTLSALDVHKQELRSQLSALQREYGLTDQPGMSSTRAALITSLLNERVVWSEVFRQFSRIVPPGLWFDSLEGSSTGAAEIRLRGGALSYDAVSQLLLAMEKSAYFVKPELVSAQKTIVRGRDVVAFEIACGVRKGPVAR
jgi:Tfp pilus assembly protein PilN